MTAKKIIISTLALISIVIALYGIIRWSERQNALPVRQSEEIR